MTLTIAPPDMQPTTASSAVVVDVQFLDTLDGLVEEPMDYSPVATGRLDPPPFADEDDSADDVGSGPMGY